MKKLVFPLMVLTFAGAALAASPAQASDYGTGSKYSSRSTRPCRKVTIAAMNKTNTPDATRDADRGSDLNAEFAAQHPSGGG